MSDLYAPVVIVDELCHRICQLSELLKAPQRILKPSVVEHVILAGLATPASLENAAIPIAIERIYPIGTSCAPHGKPNSRYTFSQ